MRMTLPQAVDKYDKYVREKLFRPYRTYLIKLTHLKQLRADNEGPNVNKDVAYLSFNLLTLLVAELGPAVKELTGYLKQAYPFLYKYMKLLT